MPNDRKIVINVVPQSPAAWENISLAVFFVACAVGVHSIAGCCARVDEARHRAESVKITDNTVITAKP
ncbi:MAG TPA: hypothetical protein VEC57_00240 [Candidatus Limnocylindrales bacterium]|nr:hypothetical protein [Candidatus Limnocylindrales bacterium]